VYDQEMFEEDDMKSNYDELTTMLTVVEAVKLSTTHMCYFG